MGLLIGKNHMQGLLGERLIKRFNEILKSYHTTGTVPAEKAEDEEYPKVEKPPKDGKTQKVTSQTSEK